MSQSIELPDPIYDALKRAADAGGTTPVGWLAAHLPRPADAAAPALCASLADLFAGRVGRIRSGGRTALSEHCVEKFTDHLETKRREGRL